MSRLQAGLDVADRTTSICVMDEAGLPLFETKVATTPTAIAAALKPYRRSIERVGLETGTKSAWLHKALVKKRLPMICLDARHAHAALAARANKTDRNDARGIALLLSRGLFTTAHVKSDDALRIMLLLHTRKAMLRKALDLRGMLRSNLKMFGGQLERRGRRFVVKEPRDLHDAALSRLYGATHRASVALYAEVALLDKLVLRLASADPICRRLMTVPGVGPLTALAFRAGVDDPLRFKSSKCVAAYFGLTPRRYQSGQTSFQGSISRHGDKAVRTALYTAAAVMLSNSKSPSTLRRWGLDLVKRKGLKIASVACARKMAVVLHRMWMTEQNFNAGAL